MNDAQLTILVVDDCEIQRMLLGEVLAYYRYKVLYAQSGQEALQILSDNQVSFVLSDLQMPSGGGLWLLERMNESFPSVPIVILSADPGVRAKDVIALGAKGFLGKPYQVSSILSLLPKGK